VPPTRESLARETLTRETLNGIYVPLVTPFDEAGRINVEELHSLIELMLESGVSGFVAAGTTGEGYALSFDERRLVLSTIVDRVSGAVPVLAGVGGMSTHEAIDQAILAKRAGIGGLMLAAPSYCLPTESELATHVTNVVKAVELPTVLYDYPARTGVSFSHPVVEALAGNELIIGIKEASGDVSRIDWLASDFGDQLAIVCGADLDSPAFLDTGVNCWIGGIANLLPKAHVAMLDPSHRDEVFAAISPILGFIESGNYNAKIKAGMNALGAHVGAPRGPIESFEAHESGLTELRSLLVNAGEWAPTFP
jgi:4-hydroxy-tetrahydrodipicolinate synthase